MMFITEGCKCKKIDIATALKSDSFLAFGVASVYKKRVRNSSAGFCESLYICHPYGRHLIFRIPQKLQGYLFPCVPSGAEPARAYHGWCSGHCDGRTNRYGRTSCRGAFQQPLHTGACIRAGGFLWRYPPGGCSRQL